MYSLRYLYSSCLGAKIGRVCGLFRRFWRLFLLQLFNMAGEGGNGFRTWRTPGDRNKIVSQHYFNALIVLLKVRNLLFEDLIVLSEHWASCGIWQKPQESKILKNIHSHFFSVSYDLYVLKTHTCNKSLKALCRSQMPITRGLAEGWEGKGTNDVGCSPLKFSGHAIFFDVLKVYRQIWGWRGTPDLRPLKSAVGGCPPELTSLLSPYYL